MRIAPLLTLLPAAVASLGAQQLPSVRSLGPVVATSSEPIRAITTVRPLSNGSVLVNDVAGRRVLLFDSTLASFSVVADTTPATGNAYSGRVAGLVPFKADSTLFVDPMSLSMLVLDPAGKIARVMSVPNAQDAGALAGVLGAAGFDAGGRLVYRAMPRFQFRMPAGGGPPVPPTPPDSAFIFRVDLATRKVDTLGTIKAVPMRLTMTQDENGRLRASSTIHPLPTVDEWAVLADGSVAIVRGRDYHIDWVNADGSRTSSPKMPYEWQRLSDEDKVAFIDSVKAARERMGANAPLVMMGGGPTVIGGGPGAAGAGDRVAIIAGRAAAEGAAAGAPGARGGGAGPGGGPAMAPPQVNFVEPSELPDYKPPFLAGGVRADAEGNLWIRTTRGTTGGWIYDIVNRNAEVVDRVAIPVDRTIAGFAPGIVYLAVRDANGAKLERVKTTGARE